MKEYIRKRALNSYRVCDDIPHNIRNRIRTPIQKNKRSGIKIGIIDDQAFEAGLNLKNYGYEIEEIGDIKRIDEAKTFPIILCDLMSVGVHFDSDGQGASVIKEIKKNYPAILIVAYTGASGASSQAQKAKQFADDFIKKDAEIEEWVTKLDGLIDKATDSKLIWLRIRYALVNENIDTRTILLLEDAYVRSISAGGDKGVLENAIKSGEISAMAKSIIINLLSSAIFLAITK